MTLMAILQFTHWSVQARISYGRKRS